MTKKIIKEINISIFKPYLIHVEFEVLNILTQIELSKDIQEIYEKCGFNLQFLFEIINQFLYRIRNLIKSLKF